MSFVIPGHSHFSFRPVRNYISNHHQTLDASQIGKILSVAGPLVVKYLVPFIKELASSINSSSVRLKAALPLTWNQRHW